MLHHPNSYVHDSPRPSTGSPCWGAPATPRRPHWEEMETSAQVYAQRVQRQLDLFATAVDGTGKYRSYITPIQVLELGRDVVRFCPEQKDKYLSLLVQAQFTGYFDMGAFSASQATNRISRCSIVEELANLEKQLEVGK